MKRFVFFLLGLLVAGLLLVLSLPFILSTSLGLQTATKLASRKLPGNLQAESWELAWIGTQKLHGVRYSDEEKGLVISLPVVEIDNSLALLLSGTRDRVELRVQGEIHLDGEGSEKITLQDLTAQVGIPTKGGPLVATLEGTPHYRGGTGRLHAQVEFWNKTLDAKVELKDFPGRLLATLAHSDELGALLGDWVSMTAQTHVQGENGSLGLTVNASHSKWYLNAAVLDQEVSLNEPFRGEIQVNKELSQLVLKHINPLLVTAIGAPKPIYIRVEPQDFRIPLHTHHILKEAKVARATVDFGKVVVENGGPLQLFMDLVQSPTAPQAQTMETWFTPQYLSLTEGILTLERMDTLIHESFHLASWGKVNLLHDRVDMMVGIPQDTLKERFGVKGLDESYVLQTPLRGESGRVQFDYAGVLAQIATLRARSSSQEGSRAIGSLLQAVSGNKHSDKPAPQPTTQPFPWGDAWKRRGYEKDTESKVEMKEKRNKEVPINQIIDFFMQI